jgi:hypothetical protein
MREIIFPASTYNPLFVVIVALLWLGCIAVLFVPRFRRYSRGSSIFFKSNSPMGRGSSRARMTRTVFLFAILTGDLVANLRLPSPWGTVLELGLAAIACVSLLASLSLIVLNWPHFLAPRSTRAEHGAISEWLGLSNKHH